MSSLPNCPACGSEHTYEDGPLYVCPECAHEWAADAGQEDADGTLVVKGAFGNLLADGDAVTVIKDLKVKGTSAVVKVRSEESAWSTGITISTARSMESVPCS